MKKLGILLCIAAMLLAGCAQSHPEASAQPESEASEGDSYIGEYLDYDNNEPNLQIAKGNNGTYVVQIRIYRLTELGDGIGELTPEGMVFKATDAAGNPIRGIITLEGQIATVAFTDSTWELLEKGAAFQYRKSSDVPNLWCEP